VFSISVFLFPRSPSCVLLCCQFLHYSSCSILSCFRFLSCILCCIFNCRVLVYVLFSTVLLWFIFHSVLFSVFILYFMFYSVLFSIVVLSFMFPSVVRFRREAVLRSLLGLSPVFDRADSSRPSRFLTCRSSHPSGPRVGVGSHSRIWVVQRFRVADYSATPLI
jgi:hypothetical protein